MKKIYLLAFVLITYTSCSYISNKDILTKLPLEAALARLDKGDVQFYYAGYKDSIGGELSGELRKKLNQGHLKRDFYVNQSDSIKEIRVSALKDDVDVFNEIQLRSAMSFPMRNFKFEKVDCSKVKEVIEKSIGADQYARNNNAPSKDIDKENLVLTISIIEKCGWSTIDTSQINDVFLLVQHMESEYMARYYPVFIEFHKKGVLSNINYARLLDRLLMNNGFEQIYGTQVVDKGFFAIRDIKNVDSRRQKLGLESIENYAFKSGFVFDPSN